MCAKFYTKYRWKHSYEDMATHGEMKKDKALIIEATTIRERIVLKIYCATQSPGKFAKNSNSWIPFPGIVITSSVGPMNLHINKYTRINIKEGGSEAEDR